MKKSLLLLLVGALLGAWVGVNLYKGNAPFSNPFEYDSVIDQLQHEGSDLLDKGKDWIHDKTR